MSNNNSSVRWGSLPDEILTHIFVFLHIKSIIICTSVSKAWKSLIQNPTSISTHLHHSHNRNLLLFCLYPQIHKVSYVFYNEDDPHFTQHSSFDYPFHVPFRVVGICDGLLCLSEDFRFISISERLCLWNPCVIKLVNLPSPSATYTGFLGFGFDPITKDYRVVRFVTSKDSLDLANPQPEVEIYSLPTGEWRVIRTGLFCICTLRSPEPHAFVNGAIHWVAYRVTDDGFQPFVLVFDLATRSSAIYSCRQNFQIPMKILVSYCIVLLLCIWVCLLYGNSIGYSYEKQFICHDGHGRRHFILWVMKEYGGASSWTPFFTVDVDFGEVMPRPIGFRRNGNFVFVLSEGKLVSWNPESKEFKDLRMIGDHNTFVDSYLESLVLLDKAANGAVS